MRQSHSTAPTPRGHVPLWFTHVDTLKPTKPGRSRSRVVRTLRTGFWAFVSSSTPHNSSTPIRNMTLGGAGAPPKATAPSAWAMELQRKVEAHPVVKQRRQSGSARAFIDVNWTSEWGTGGQSDITDLRISQKPSEVGEPLQDAFMLNGGSYRPPLTSKTDKQVLMRDGNSELCTLHDILLRPHDHLRAKNGCWKVKDENSESETVGLAWSVLFVPCPDGKDFVEIALNTNYYQATNEKNPNKIWCVNYGSGPMIAAGSTPGGYQCHMNRNDAGNPCYVKVEVSKIQASDRLGELSEMSLANRKEATQEQLTKDGDIITLTQISFLPDDDLPMDNSSYVDPLAVDKASDAPVYRNLSAGAFTVELTNGSEFEMDEEYANMEHVKDPMHYVAEGHRRGPGLPRVDKIKVIAVRGEVTDDIITMASDWLHERNSGQLMPLEAVAAHQVEHEKLLPISETYKAHLEKHKKRPGEGSSSSPIKSPKRETDDTEPMKGD